LLNKNKSNQKTNNYMYVQQPGF